MWQQFFFWAEAGHGRTLRDHREDEDDSRVKEEISTGPPFLERTRSPKLLLTPPPMSDCCGLELFCGLVISRDGNQNCS